MAHRGATPNNLNDFLVSYIQDLIGNLRANKVARLFTEKNFIPGVKTYTYPTPGTRSATSKTLGTAMVPADVDSSVATLAVDKWYYSANLIEKREKLTTDGRLSESDIQEMGEAVQNQFEADVLGLRSSLSGLTAEAATTDTDIALYNHIVSAVGKLNAANIPQSDRLFIIDPALETRMFTANSSTGAIPIVTAQERLNEFPVQDGLIGMILGVPIYRSTAVVSATVSGTTTYYNFLGHKTAFSYMLAQDVQYSAQEMLSEGGIFEVFDAIYGVACTAPARGLDFTITAT